MSRHHVCKQTDDEGEGLNKYPQKLYQYEDRFHKPGNTRRIENMSPKVFIGAEQNNNKRNQSQHYSKSDITCYISRTRN